MREGLKDLQSSANECLRTQPHQQDSRAGKPGWHQALICETNTGNMSCSGAQSITDIVRHCPETGMTKPHSFGIFIILLPMFLKALTWPSQQQVRSSRVLTRGQFISPASVMQVAPGQLMPQGTWTFCSPWGETLLVCHSPHRQSGHLKLGEMCPWGWGQWDGIAFSLGKNRGVHSQPSLSSLTSTHLHRALLQTKPMRSSHLLPVVLLSEELRFAASLPQQQMMMP